MSEKKVDRYGFGIEEHVFNRYFAGYTIALRYYPELFNLIEKHPDIENTRTISSNMNVVFAILRYQEMTKDLVNLQAVSNSNETDEKISQEVQELREIIDVLEHLKYTIAHDPEGTHGGTAIKDKILDLDNFRK
ncbi:hypothetical protein JCM15457_2259 [Liquorilactobacillus sucicola DSM 21376 = JCM 15457]|uniref:hypothetical protein n=1 Tax=Liquorilactobacillus sucicola TaxID=519050 RepID=UPI0004326C83|nr:hypothetical protein [Liquorilactobacillus sucicola]GAJ27284.1 hypothetical protein JCM15457_2259 [Liquorilactobacillus sucicola DSM 21376 = JCM 15457]